MPGLLAADGTPLHFERWGDPSAPVTVVLLHGYALDRRSWRAIAPVLAEAAEKPVAVLAYDQRGHGESGEVRAASATMGHLADDLAEVLEKVIPDGKVVLVGHDMGGLAILSLAQRHPEVFAARVAGIGLLAMSAGGVTPDAIWPNALGKLGRDLEMVFGTKLIGLVREHTSKAVTAGLRWWLFGDDPVPADVELTVRMIRGNWPQTVSAFRPALDAYTRESALSQVGAVRNGTSVVLPGVGHVVPLEAAPQVVPRLLALANRAHRQD
ncbi:alpha/beta fold hydrolase [Amycolatopsis keratiniphila]|uniref:alpha/beta fold hydrolase n=1 Tax=Amycolatopsis keratiniphila TaxID=129921 RepID=UPI00087C66DB|nr:alpha/beta fold hydrolase [Amycolatopsis keratiniphila]OLZ61712.1 alpha/beta hydrolase [Amycolatopsis keratiniphila subsp. nogabecina]SDU16552.1 Alpha/beta hydrolase family protein [Amycolatopsis keratiniphila]